MPNQQSTHPSAARAPPAPTTYPHPTPSLPVSLSSTRTPAPQGDNLFKLFGATGLASSPAAYMLLAAAIMIPTVWLPDLKALSFLGAAGVTATCTVSAAVRGVQPTGSGTVKGPGNSEHSSAITWYAAGCGAAACRWPKIRDQCPLRVS